MKATRRDAADLMHRGIMALADAESNGMRVDVAYLRSEDERLRKRIAKLEIKMRNDKVFRIWKKHFGHKTKLRSRQQLGTVLFDIMGLKGGKRTEGSKDKQQRWQVDEEILQDIHIPFVQGYIRAEKLKNLRAKFQGIGREVCGEFVRPFQNLHIARSFRSSVSSFNGQNIPTRNEMLAKKIRPVFIPRKGHILVEFDLKGAEVCVGACVHQDPRMIKYVSDPTKDMHRDVASQIFDLPKNQISKATRSEIKTDMVFAEFYGAYYKTCAPRIWKAMERHKLSTEDGKQTLFEVLAEQGITELGDCDPTNRDSPEEGTFVHRVQQVEKDLWGRRFKKYAQWKWDYYDEYKERGYFDVVTGFRCTGVYSKKQVGNYPIQGPSFHCDLMALIMLNDWLKEKRLKSKIIGQIHDSVLMDIKKDELERIVEKMRRIITVELPRVWDWIIVPLVVEVEGSDVNWYEKQPIEEYMRAA